MPLLKFGTKFKVLWKQNKALSIIRRPTSAKMDNVLYSTEIEQIIEHMVPQDLKSIASQKWLEWHRQLQKLNQQALVEASQLKDEQVKETLVQFKKIPVLIHEALVINIWRTKVFPTLLQLQPTTPNTFIAYTILYHEAVTIALLELVLYHDACCETLDDAAGDLISYAGDQVYNLLTLKFNKGENIKTPIEELLMQQNNLAFEIGIRCLAIIRYLCDNLDKLPSFAVKRIYEIQDVPMLFCQLLQVKPWLDNNKKYSGGHWVTWDGEGVIQCEAQVWLALRQLMLNPAIQMYYELTETRCNTLSKLLMLITPTLLDQMSPLIELQQFLSRLSLAEIPNNAPKPFLLEVMLEIRESIMKECAGKWRKIAKAQVDDVFPSDPKILMEKGKLLSDAYNADFIENFEKVHIQAKSQKESCKMCNKPSAQRCSRCKKVWYCSRNCQVQDWPTHKETCGIESN